MDPLATEHGLDATLALAAQGDGDAWTRLVGLYSPRVYALLTKQCGDRDLAQEITQATFVKVVTKLDRHYQELGKFEAWLFRIAMNALRDEMRRRKRQAQVMDMSGSASARDGEASPWAAAEAAIEERSRQGGGPGRETPLETLSRAEQVEQLKVAIATLSPADQEILLMRHTAGLSFPQIAESLGQPLGTVLARGHRALAKLKKLMEDHEEQPGAAAKPG